MHRSKYAVLAGLTFILVVILAATFIILNSSVEKAPIPTQRLLPTAKVASNQLDATIMTATPGQVVQRESLATSLPLPTTTPPLSLPTVLPPSVTEPLPMS